MFIGPPIVQAGGANVSGYEQHEIQPCWQPGFHRSRVTHGMGMRIAIPLRQDFSHRLVCSPVYVTWQNEPWYRPDRDRAPITLVSAGGHTAGLSIETGRNGNGCASNLLRGVQNRAFASSALRGSLTTYGWPHDTNDSGSDECPTSG